MRGFFLSRSPKRAGVYKGNLGLFPGKQLGDGEDLDLWYLAMIRRVIEACLGGFHLHRGGWWCERQEHADFGLFPLYDMGQIPDHRHRDASTALDRDNGLFGLLAIGLEVNQAINARVRAFFLAPIGHRIDQRDRPPLELVLILICECLGARKVLGRAMYLILETGESIIEPLFDK